MMTAHDQTREAARRFEANPSERAEGIRCDTRLSKWMREGLAQLIAEAEQTFKVRLIVEVIAPGTVVVAAFEGVRIKISPREFSCWMLTASVDEAEAKEIHTVTFTEAYGHAVGILANVGLEAIKRRAMEKAMQRIQQRNKR